MQKWRRPVAWWFGVDPLFGVDPSFGTDPLFGVDSLFGVGPLFGVDARFWSRWKTRERFLGAGFAPKNPAPDLRIVMNPPALWATGGSESIGGRSGVDRGSILDRSGVGQGRYDHMII